MEPEQYEYGGPESGPEPGPDDVIELGDEITIINELYGPVRGRIYYRGEDLISIMPDGVSDRVYNFQLIDNEFVDELGVSEVKIHRKHIEEGFVRQHDLRVGQLVETFGADGTRGMTFRILGVNEDADAIEVEEWSSGSGRMEIEFDYTGIPRDLPFVVIRNREPPPAVVTADAADADMAEVGASAMTAAIPNVGEIGEESGVAVEAAEAADEEEDEFELEVIGVITLPVQIEVEDIPSAERIYPDSVQKADALNDYTTRLTSIAQKDPRILRDIRILVEKVFQLKQDIIDVGADGIPRGVKRTSFDTLSELLKEVHVPLGRPVLDVNAKVYEQIELDDTGVAKEEDLPVEGVDADGLRVFPQVKETRAALDAMTQMQEKGNGFWVNMLSYMNKFGTPWFSTDDVTWSAIKDSEFFRGGIPDMENPIVSGYTSQNGVVERGELGMSLGRALGPFYYSDAKKRQKLAFPGEAAPLMNYILFPLKEAGSFGTTRTGQLGVDMNNSMGHPRWTAEAIKAAGGIQEVATGNSFVVLGVKGNTFGNIPLVDYLDALEIGGRGFDDFTGILSQLGLSDMEVSSEVGKLLENKLDKTRSGIIEHLRGLRESMKAAEEGKIGIAEGAEVAAPAEAIEMAEGNEILKDIINKVRTGSPLIGKSDMVVLSALLKEAPDLFIATAGNQVSIVSKQQLIARRKEYIKTLENARKVRLLEETKGDAPIPNKCKHVNLMRDIRRIDDTTTRFLHMVNLIRNYQGSRDMNWINCNICDQRLICIHEMLQMQQYLHPNEKEVLQKELILNFSGPIVGGQYQCRNCGQAIADIDYDKGMQFDDEGRPLSGRGEVIDEDALRKEEIDDVLKGQIGSNDTTGAGVFMADNEEDEILHLTIKEVCDRIGIFPDQAGYVSMLNAVKSYMARQKSREEYVRLQTARMKQGGVAPISYDKYIKRIMVGCIGATILVEVQTKIPDYVVRYTLPGCVNPGFFGMPMGSDADKTGIQYISCAIASIMKNESPWNMTDFQNEKNDVKRQQLVARYVEAIVKDISTDVNVQYSISAKKLYLKKTFGAEGGDLKATDSIIRGFLPRPYIVTKDAAAAAEEPIIPEVSSNERLLADLWIQTGHKMARKTALVVKGSPFAETTCCMSDIRAPGQFWGALSDLPKFKKRSVRGAVGGTRFMVPFVPRQLSDVLVAPKPELYHRVFLNVCFQGPRMGLPHEPGLTLKCPWCGLVFPSHPRVLNYDTEGKSALEGQGVEISEETFRGVLDASHKSKSIVPYIPGVVKDGLEMLRDLVRIEPAPIAAWAGNIEGLINGVSSLTSDATDVDIALATATFSDIILTAERAVRGKLGGSAGATLGLIAELNGQNMHSVLYSYFLVPFQRLCTQMDPDAHMRINPEYELSDKHIADIKNGVIAPNESLQRKFVAVFKSPKASFANAKLRYYVRQMAAALKGTERLYTLAALKMPGGADIYRDIIKYLLFVPLAILLNSNEVPPEEYDTSVTNTIIDSSIKLLTDVTSHTLERYKEERLFYSDKELKERIQIINEKEAMYVLGIFDKMSDEMREIELMKKRYGIGRWAVGGTSLIYAYDPDRYDAEREERIMAGIVDMSEPGPDGVMPDGRGMDMYGFMMETGGEDDERLDLGGDYEDSF